MAQQAWTPPESDFGNQSGGVQSIDGHPLIIKPPEQPKPQGKEVKGNYAVDLNSPQPTAVPIQGLPAEHFHVLQPGEKGYLPDHPGQVNEVSGQVSYGPQTTVTATPVDPRIAASNLQNDLYQKIGTLAHLRDLVNQSPIGTGPNVELNKRIPFMGGDLSNIENAVNSISGDQLQKSIANMPQGTKSALRSKVELQALQAANLYGLNPTQTQPDFLNSLGKVDQGYRRAYASSLGLDINDPQVARSFGFPTSGGPQGTPNTRERFVTAVDGKPIIPIMVPLDATDADVRSAVRARGYNVPDSVGVNTTSRDTPIQNGGGGNSPSGNFLNEAANSVEGATDAARHSFLNLATAGLIDPISAGAQTVGTNIGNLLAGRNDPRSEGQIYDANLAQTKGESRTNDQAHPIASWAGTAAAIPQLLQEAAALGTTKLGQFLAPKGAGILSRAVRAPVLAAPIGAVEGASNAGTDNRVGGAVKGALSASAAAALLSPAMDIATGVASPLVDRVLPNGVWNRFVNIAPEADPAAMAARAAELRRNGVDPAALDTLNNASLDQVRGTVGGRPGSTAATTLNDESAARTVAAPARAATAARKAIGPTPEQSAQIPGQAASPMETRLVLGAHRDTQFDNTISPVRSQPITLPGDVTELLSGPDMNGVVKGALKFTRSPAERQELLGFSREVSSGPKTVNVGGRQLTPAEVEQHFPNQAADILHAAGITPPRALSLGAADALRRSIANSEGANTPALTAVRRDLTTFLENSVPEYGAAMKAYRTQSGIASPEAGGNGGVSNLGAKKGEALSLGENVLSANPEEMRIQARNLNMDGPVSYPSGAITPREAAGEGAVRAVEQAASKSGGVKSLGKQMATPEQQARNRTILPNVRATILEDRLQAEAGRVEAADRAAPSSAPGPVQPDSTDAAHAAGIAAFHSPYHGVKMVAGLMARARISPDQADRIAQGLVNPKETDAIIKNIQKAGYNQQRARQLYSMIKLQLATAAARMSTAK